VFRHCDIVFDEYVLYKDRLENSFIDKETVGVDNSDRQLVEILVNTSFARFERRYEVRDENAARSQVAPQVDTPKLDTFRLFL